MLGWYSWVGGGNARRPLSEKNPPRYYLQYSIAKMGTSMIVARRLNEVDSDKTDD